ncbi:MAG: putative secondary metabolism biosynthetic enzyme [Sclerophora amabilis]|nr:MAG: putative secondary metabolism biosynthetic enzyme [Sclerophora amabilis]
MSVPFPADHSSPDFPRSTPAGRRAGSMPQALTFDATSSRGAEVLHLLEYDLPSPRSHEVLIKFLACPINPLDLNVLAGKYPFKPKNFIQKEYVAGFDGVAKVVESGSDANGFQTDDLVIPNGLGLGTWRTHATLDATSLLKLPPRTDVAFAAILKMGVMPAYLLVEDMRMLKPGDWIIQNAGTGVISQMVSQFARLRGVRTISVIRDREERDTINGVGSTPLSKDDIVLEEQELPHSSALEGKRIVLALDSVFGASAEKIAARLSLGATFVNFGLLAGGGPAARFNLTSEHIFWKQITFKSFRSSQQLAQRTETEINHLYEWFTQLFNEGQLRLPHLTTVEWDPAKVEVGDHLRESIDRAQNGGIGTKKTILLFKDALNDKQ